MDNLNLSEILDADIASQGNRTIVYRDLGNVIVPIERYGLKIGPQRIVSIEKDVVLVQVANVSVIQSDGSVISCLDEIYGRCGAVHFNAMCGNYVLNKNIAICFVTEIPLCLRHRMHLKNGTFISNQLPKHILYAAKVGLLNGANSENSLARVARAD